MTVVTDISSIHTGTVKREAYVRLKCFTDMSTPASPAIFVLRRRRTNVACSNCRKRKIKCITSGDPPQEPCERCARRGLACQYTTIGDQDSGLDAGPPPRRPQSPSQSPTSPVTPATELSSSSFSSFQNYDARRNPNLRPQSPQTNRAPRPTPSVPQGSQSTAPQTWVPPYPPHTGTDQYTQLPSYGGQNSGFMPNYNTGNSTNFYTSPLPYARVNPPGQASWYQRPPSTNFICTTCMTEPCYCGSLRG
ncbi:hypothetical protein K438DRAFT_547564 [Mycena galopus ATCC 62051]|nr:hypothetical protein K438DRAFT_547564 [Mycena galopus ATCC 62051]